MDDPSEVMPLLRYLQDQQAVMQEAVMQLIEQQVRPDPTAAALFERGMRRRLEDILPDRPDAQSESDMTLVLAALLASAGRPPKT